jgi:hypothetical protein
LISLSQIRYAKNFAAYISANRAGVKLEPIYIALILKKHVIKLRFKAVLNILPLHYTT